MISTASKTGYYYSSSHLGLADGPCLPNSWSLFSLPCLRTSSRPSLFSPLPHRPVRKRPRQGSPVPLKKFSGRLSFPPSLSRHPVAFQWSGPRAVLSRFLPFAVPFLRRSRIRLATNRDKVSRSCTSLDPHLACALFHIFARTRPLPPESPANALELPNLS